MRSRSIVLLSLLLAGCVVQRAPEGPRRGCPTAASETLILPGERAVFIPTGPEDQSTTSARVVRTDMQGMITIESERGPTDAWVVDATGYEFGDPVEIRMTVRAVRIERRQESEAPPETPPPRWTEPGDHAIVTGGILSVSPRGTITVNSPRGPIRVWVTLEPDRYCVGRWVEVSTRVRPAS